MNKETFFKIFFFMLMLVFCSYFSGVAFAEYIDRCKTLGNVQTFPGNVIVPPEWRDIIWASNNPKEIDRNKAVSVSVINGTYPYSWSVSGTGFSVDTAATGLSNKLTSNDTACGAATVKVTSSDGSSTDGYVRCTAGAWANNFTIDSIPAGWDGDWKKCCWPIVDGCGSDGIQGHYYFDPKHRAARCFDVLCCGNGYDLTAKSYTFNDGFTVTHYRMTFEGTGLDGNTHGCTKFRRICGYETYGQSWECN